MNVEPSTSPVAAADKPAEVQEEKLDSSPKKVDSSPKGRSKKKTWTLDVSIDNQSQFSRFLTWFALTISTVRLHTSLTIFRRKMQCSRCYWRLTNLKRIM